MRNLTQRYVSEVQRAFGSWAAWPPEDALTIGTLGRLDKGVFVPESSLAELGSRVETHEGPGVSERFYATEGQVSLSLPGSLNSGQASASATIEFSSASAIVMALSQCKTIRPASPLALLDAMCTHAQAGTFQEDWFVVSSLTSARSGLIAMSQNAGATLQVSFRHQASSLQSALLSGDGSVGIAAASSMGFHTTIEGSTTPLFDLQRLSRRQGRIVLRDDTAPPKNHELVNHLRTIYPSETADAAAHGEGRRA